MWCKCYYKNIYIYYLEKLKAIYWGGINKNINGDTNNNDKNKHHEY